ncbi:MAG: DUF5103 domain-containing protein [Bacteroidales bacterium]|nr:DUF5103 domain-containing protein [Bacteroidales bacterium]
MRLYIRYILCCIICFLYVNIYAQSKPYRTASIDSRIHSLKVESSSGLLYPPVITLNTDEYINISFDLFEEEHQDLSYSIVHCNANWQPSMLSSLEYIDGFDIQEVYDWELSFNTYQSYVNYQITLPNDEVQFKVSGNYAVVVYPQNRSERPLLYACFSVSEDAVKVNCTSSSRTDKGYADNYQQVSFNINKRDYNIVNPVSDLKIYVMQNNRLDNMAYVSTPQYFNNDRIAYEHNPKLIFDAGNEYRRFEIVSTRYKGMGVDNLSYFDPYFHATLERDYPRESRTYSFDQTQRGRYVIRESDYDEEGDTQADYFVVHFSLDVRDMMLPEGDIYIDGELSEYRFSDNNRMLLNPQTGLYEKIMLLKQGSYNYQYLFVPKGETIGKASVIEGNKYETSNEYRVNVYHRVPGERYDRLIGVGRCMSEN